MGGLHGEVDVNGLLGGSIGWYRSCVEQTSHIQQHQPIAKTSLKSTTNRACMQNILELGSVISDFTDVIYEHALLA